MIRIAQAEIRVDGDGAALDDPKRIVTLVHALRRLVGRDCPDWLAQLSKTFKVYR